MSDFEAMTYVLCDDPAVGLSAEAAALLLSGEWRERSARGDTTAEREVAAWVLEHATAEDFIGGGDIGNVAIKLAATMAEDIAP